MKKDPRLVNLFRTNLVPNKLELAEVKSTLLSGQSELTRLETEMQRTWAEFSRLEQKHSALRKQMNACKAVISPIRLIPTELLAEIFVLMPDPFPYYRPRSDSAPLLLCQVCSVWRNVAIGLPALWTGITITHLSTENFTKQMNLANIWLDRAKSLPVSMRFDVSEPSTNELVFDAIPRFFPKCQTLHLILPLPVWKRILEHPSGHVGLLENLHVLITGDSEGTVFHTTNTLFKDAPRLRAMHFTPGLWPISIQDMHLLVPVHQLVHLSLDSIHLTLDADRQFYRQCTNLEVLVLTIMACDPGHIDPDLRVILPKLRRLHIVSCRNPGIHQLLQMLTLPVLSEIDMGDPYITLWPHQAYMDMHTRSLCDIHVFSTSLTLTEEEFKEVFQTMPSLRTLRLDFSPSDSSVPFRLLTYDAAHPFLRNLTSIYLPVAKGTVEQLTQMITSRWWPDTDITTAHQGVSRLDSVNIKRVGVEKSEFDGALLHQWAEEGLKIQDYFHSSGIYTDF